MGKNEQTLFKKLQADELTSSSIKKDGFRYSLLVKIGIIISTILICAIFFPVDFGKYSAVLLGSEWNQETLKAEFPFAISKPTAVYKREVREANEKTPIVFSEDVQAFSSYQKQISIIQKLILSKESFTNKDSLAKNIGLSANSLSYFEKYSLPKRKVLLDKIISEILNFQSEMISRRIINFPKSSISGIEISIRIGDNSEIILPKSQVVDSAECIGLADRLFLTKFSKEDFYIAREILLTILKPSAYYNERETEIARNAAIQNVPKTLGFVREGEIIVQKGERISETVLYKLQSYQNTRGLYSELNNSVLSILNNIGEAFLYYSLIVIFLITHRRKLFEDNIRFAGFSFSLIFVAVLAWISMQLPHNIPYEFIIALPAVSMLIAILFDSRTAFQATVGMSLMVAGIRGDDIRTFILFLLGGTLAGYTVRDLRNRTQIFRSIGSIAIGYILVIIIFGIEHAHNFILIGKEIILALSNAVLSPILTLGALYVVERALNISTDLRLEEYDNLEHPLLQEMSEKAPGTYQHTLAVANLAESGARAIGANAILAKVGAYFHDIGKIPKSEYFVENQIEIGNKHDLLSPQKSTRIIRNHVEDGLEIGIQYKLPRRILEFIPMHHGTMLIKYFYVKALEDAEEKGTSVTEKDYRYPGPKPNSKETGILMFADACEALARTVSSPQELDSAITKIFQDRIEDGQLDECDLTLKDIAELRETFIRILSGMMHQRVKYKALPEEENETSDDN